MKKEYLALISVMGGGCFHRAEGTPEEVARACKGRFKRDWKTLFPLKRNQTIKVNVIEVTGLSEVFMDGTGFYHKGRLIDRPVQVIEV